MKTSTTLYRIPTVIAFLCCAAANALAGPLVLSTQFPTLDNGDESGVAEFQVDLSPEDKANLSGSGAIEVFIGQNPYTAPPYPTELLGNGTVLVTYSGQSTTPATVRFRKAPWMPNRANEIDRSSYSCTVTTAPNSPIGAQSDTAWGVSRGSHYATVRSYMEKHRNLNSWIGVFLDAGGNLDGLVQYQVPEPAFVAWAPVAEGPDAIAHGHSLGYQPQEDYGAFGGGSIQGWPGLYSGQAWGWNSRAEMMALQLDYERDVMPVNPNVSFSLRNRVPVSYFLSKVSITPGNSGEKDYAIAAAWNREQGIERLNDLGLPATQLLASLFADYRLSDFCSVAPHALEAAARTYSDPNWRSDKPLALVVYNREVLYDGAFSEADIIATLARTHRLVVTEAHGVPTFLDGASKAHQRNGNFDIVVLCGHGNEAMASVFDIANTDAFAEMGTMLTPEATVLLASCSGAHFNPWFVQTRINGGHSTIHIAAAMQAAMPSARVVAASDLITKAMVRYDAAATKPEERYRVAFQGGHAYGDVPGLSPRGTPKDWLRREFGPTEDWAALEVADNDGDGQANWFEYLAGTNPRSAKDYFKISNFTINGGIPTIEWTGSPRNEHIMQFKVFSSANPGTGQWQECASSINPSIYGNTTYTDSSHSHSGEIFYRVGTVSNVTTGFVGNQDKGSQTIGAFTPIGAKAVGSAFSVIPPTASSGLPVVLSVKAGPATISGNNTVTSTGLGTVVLAANQPGNVNYNAAPEVTTSFMVTKASQIISAFNAIPPKALWASPFNVSAPSASSGLPVTLSVKSGPATISANDTVTLTGVGAVVLAANQAGNVNYNAAPEVTTSFVVGRKGTQTISAFATIEPKLVGAVPFVISAPSASSALPVVLRIKSGPAKISTNRTVTITGPGNVTIAANQAGNANFNPAPEVTTTFLVSRPLSTLTITMPEATEGTVTPGFAGATTREIGTVYTVTAIPANGMVSKGWRKGNATVSANATLKFTMEANMQLMPLFAPDFSKLAGTYNALVGDGEIGIWSAQDMQSFPSKNGFVTFSLGSTGALSGKLSIDGQTSRFTGNFTTSRIASITIVRAGKSPAQASLHLTPALPGEVSGNISNITVSGFASGAALSFRALRAAYTIGTASHALGNRAYTLAIPAPGGTALGHGFARVAVQKNGFATAAGRLATGDPISASAGFVDSGDGNFVMPFYSTANGIFTGEIVIPKIPKINSAELLGSFEWWRPANATASLFTEGFLGRTNVVGTRYSLITGNSLLSGNRTAAGFTLNIDPQGAILPVAIAQKGTWPSSNKPAFVQPISSGLQMTFTSVNGSVLGVFNRTINGAQFPTQFQGVMFGKAVSTGNGQPMLRGAGYFISDNQSVPVEITLL